MWTHCDMKIQIPHFLLLTQLSGLEKNAGVISYRNNAREGASMGVERNITIKALIHSLLSKS